MKIVSFSYSAMDWALQNLDLGKVNLIVGKNSAGKSRTLKTIDFVVDIITQKRDINLSWKGLNVSIKFVDETENTIEYQFLIKDNKIIEHLRVNGDAILDRKGKTTRIWNSLSNKMDLVAPPNNKLTLHTNRDLEKFPYLEQIAVWAEKSHAFKFGNVSPYEQINREYNVLTDIDDVPELLKTMNKQQKKKIVEKINSLGYKIKDIEYKEWIENRGIISVSEEGVKLNISHFSLSQGMFRTLALLIYLEYLVNEKQPATLLIDDLCEGLDYDRATKLGKIVFETCEQNNIQLLATSNDSFLMEVVDIKHWNILHRQGQIVTTINQQKYPELFKDFLFTGLSNFDFFSSDFISQKLPKI